MQSPPDDGAALRRIAGSFAAERDALFAARASDRPTAFETYARASLQQAWSLIDDLLADRNAHALERSTWAGQVADAESRVAQAESRVAEAESRVAEAEARVRNAEAARDSALALLERAKADHEATRERLNSEHVAAIARLDAVYRHSSSWRITAPLRWVSGLLSRGQP